VRHELAARLVERFCQSSQRFRVVDDETQCVAAEPVLAEDDLDDVVRRMYVGPHRAAAVDVGVLVGAQIVHDCYS
jgi:hypothetical protein